MPDRILKPDSGNDLVLQNDDGSGKIEINENASIPVTGTLDVSGATLTTSTAQKQAIVQAGPGSGTFDVSSGTLTLADNQISGDKIDGGTISNFASTGIDDNGTGTAITVDSGNNVMIDDSSDLFVKGTGTTADRVKLENSGGHGKITIKNSAGTETIILSGDGGGITGTFNGTVGTSASGFGLITHADQWRLVANMTGTGGAAITNLERNNTNFAGIGTQMSFDTSTGVFTFPTTGVYLVNMHTSLVNNTSAQTYGGIYTYMTTNNSSYSVVISGLENVPASGYYSAYAYSAMIDITSTSTHKIYFYRATSDSNLLIEGGTGASNTAFTFIRLGDT